MNKRLQVFKCDLCGNIVEVLHGGAGTLACCGQPMKSFDEQTADSATEKHVPVLEKTDGGLTVKVGSVPHPMVDAHYIEWVEVIDGDTLHRRWLSPGEDAEAVFCETCASAEGLTAREYCSIHGLWKS